METNEEIHLIHNERSVSIWKRMTHPNYALHRYIALVFMCFMGFGSYFVYDSPGAIQAQLTSDMDINTASFASLYSWYSWPNTVLCFFGGYLIDKVFGIRLGAVVFASFVLGGQIVVALGAFSNMFWLMIVGRFIFGIGGESLAVAQNTYAVSWFRGKELNAVFGLQLSFARVGSSVSFLALPWIYNAVATISSGHVCLGFVMFIAAGTCLLSLLCTVVLSFLDKRAERLLNKEATKTGEVIRFKDVKNFNLAFWLLSIICVTYYVAIFSFIGLGKVFFRRKYGFTDEGASSVDSIVYIVSILVCPLFGILVDRFGRNLTWVLLSSMLTLACHATLAFTFINPWFPMVFMGIGYSVLACALWPMVSFLIPEHQLGTAYGVMQSIQNLGLAIAAYVAGIIVDSKGYIVLEIFFLASLCLCNIFIIVLFIYDDHTNGVLNMTIEQRSEVENQQKLKKDKDDEILPPAQGNSVNTTAADTNASVYS